MVRITDTLLVSRAEHNEGHLPTLEEISLHQQKLEKIEYINRVCGDLKILQLQDNCIERIENLGRLRKLEYLNLAMNNIEQIENTQPLEKLEKLDLTLNFIGKLSGIDILRDCNVHLKSLFLMGNPCAQFQHYRDYVIALIPQLEFLDGTPIDKSERISATQRLQQIEPLILAQEGDYLSQREKEKEQNLMEVKEKSKEYDDPNLDLDEQRRKFYQSHSKHNPEYRKESQRFRQYLEDQDDTNVYEPAQVKKPRRLFDDHGKALNINEANVNFHYDDSDDINIVIEIMTYRYMDSSFIDLDVQPTYLRYVILDMWSALNETNLSVFLK